MTQDTQIVLPFARLRGKTLQADLDAGIVTSDEGGLATVATLQAAVVALRCFSQF